jgi:hypothetical protein
LKEKNIEIQWVNCGYKRKQGAKRSILDLIDFNIQEHQPVAPEGKDILIKPYFEFTFSRHGLDSVEIEIQYCLLELCGADIKAYLLVRRFPLDFYICRSSDIR